MGGMCDRFCDCAILAMSDHTFSVFLKKPKMKKKNRIERSCMYFCLHVVVHVHVLSLYPTYRSCFKNARPGQARLHTATLYLFEHSNIPVFYYRYTCPIYV